MKHFEEAVLGGEWDEVEKYLSGFTKVDDNHYSMKIFFEIRKQKHDVDILVKDLKVFSAFNEDLFKKITQLLTQLLTIQSKTLLGIGYIGRVQVLPTKPRRT